MSSRNLLNLVLLVVVAALVAIVVFKPGKKTPPVTRLTSLSASSVTKISISRPGAEQIILEKQDNKWQMLAPYKIAADGFKANSITELAEAKAVAIRLPNSLKASTYLKPRFFQNSFPILAVVAEVNRGNRSNHTIPATEKVMTDRKRAAGWGR